MYAQLSVLFPINGINAKTEIQVFGVNVDQSFDWIKAHADDIARDATGRSDYTALYLTPDDRYPRKGA